MDHIQKRLFIEYLILFFGAPLLLFITRNICSPFAILLPFVGIVFIFLHRNKSFSWSELIQMKISNRSLRFNVLIVLITGILLFISVLIFVPDRLFDLPRKNQKIWLMLCLLYPLVSAFSQEIVFRTFLFRRYKKLFHRPIYYILASAVCFSFAHIMYFSWVSVILTFILGLYLSNIYIKTKSVLLTTIIHSVLGIIVFTIGLGQYFWITIGSNL